MHECKIYFSPLFGVNDRAGEQFLRHAGRAVHHQVGIGDAGVDFLHAADGQDVAGRRTAELVGTVAGADGDGQGIAAGALDEVLDLALKSPKSPSHPGSVKIKTPSHPGSVITA